MDKFVKNYIDKKGESFKYLDSINNRLHILNNLNTDEKYVFKLLLKKESYLGNLDMLKHRFKDISSLDNIGLVPIEEIGVDAKQFYKLYKYQKLSLAQYLKDNTISALEAIGIFEKILGAVDSLHKAGKAHANLKLSNIFIDHDKKFLFTDFAFEKQSEDDHYRLPKDAKYTPLKQDIYSLGIIFYELLNWESAKDGIEKKIHIPGNLYRIIEKACIEHKLRYFKSAAEMLSFLKYSTSTNIGSIEKKEIKEIEKQDKNIQKESKYKKILLYSLIYILLALIILYLYFLN